MTTDEQLAHCEALVDRLAGVLNKLVETIECQRAWEALTRPEIPPRANQQQTRPSGSPIFTATGLIWPSAPPPPLSPITPLAPSSPLRRLKTLFGLET